MVRLVVVALLFYILIRVAAGLLAEAKSRRVRSNDRGADDMIFDPECKSYFPRREAIQRGGLSFCSRQCADQYFLVHPSEGGS